MALEMALGRKSHGRTDLYSLACVGFYLLTGGPVFDKKTPIEIIMDHAKTPRRDRRRSQGSRFPRGSKDLLMDCLGEGAEDRPGERARGGTPSLGASAGFLDAGDGRAVAVLSTLSSSFLPGATHPESPPTKVSRRPDGERAMCGRDYFFTPADTAAGRFGPAASPALRPRFNIAPQSEAPVILVEGTRLISWRCAGGSCPAWSKDPASAHRMIKRPRRATAPAKPSFRGRFRRQRALCPRPDGFYEWKREGETKAPLRPPPRLEGAVRDGGALGPCGRHPTGASYSPSRS